MTTKNEVPIDDLELDALMAELEAATQGSVEVPVTAAAPTPTPEPEPVPPVVVAAAPAPEPEPAPVEKVAEKPVKPVLAVVPKVEPVEPETAPIAAQPDPNVKPVARAPVALRFHIDVGVFRSETAVSDTNLDNCMMEQNSLRAYYGEQAAHSEAQASRIKMRFEVAEATLYDKHRKALALIGEKTTEKMIETAVKTDPLWARAKNTLIEAETIASINKSLVESLKDRKDMIVQLGADRRDEYKGQARVMASQAAQAEQGNRAQAAARA